MKKTNNAVSVPQQQKVREFLGNCSYALYIVDKTFQKTVDARQVLEAVKTVCNEVVKILEPENWIRAEMHSWMYQMYSWLDNPQMGIGKNSLAGVFEAMKATIPIFAKRLGYEAVVCTGYNPIQMLFVNRVRFDAASEECVID